MLDVFVIFIFIVFLSQGFPIDQIRPWPFNYRTNQTCRPMLLDLENDINKPIIDLAENANPWILFLETVDPDSGMQSLPHFDKESMLNIYY